MSSNWQFEWLTSWDEVLSPAFQERWERFSREAWNSHVFFHPALARAWIDTYRPLRDLRPRLAIATCEGSEALMPMVLWRRDWKNAWQRLLVPLGHGDYDYHVPLVVGGHETFSWDAAWKALLEEATARWGREFDILAIDDVRESYIGGNLPFAPQEECPFVALTMFRDVEGFWASMGSKQRTELHRRERKLKELGVLEFHVFEAGELAQAETSLEQMLSCHALRWPDAYKAPGFHRNLLRQALPRELMHFSELRLNGQPISWRLGFIHGKRFYSYMPAFRQEYAACSPGMLHLARCIEYALGRGLETYDYLRGAKSYKAHWSSGAVKTFSLHLPRDTAGSRLRNWLSDQVKPRLSPQKAAAPAGPDQDSIPCRRSGTIPTVRPGGGWEFEWVTSWDEIETESFHKQWQQWAEQACNSHVFFHPALALAWIHTYRPLRDLQPRFAIARHGTHTIFFPLVLWRRNWKHARLRVIVPLGQGDFDYSDPLVVHGASDFSWAGFWRAFWDELKARARGQFDRIEVSGIREPLAAGANGWEKEAACPWCDLSPFTDTAAFLASIKKSLRGDLNRQQRRLAAMGNLEVHVFRPDEAAAAQASVASLLAWHAHRWPRAYKAPGFHARLVDYGLVAGITHLSELRVAGRPISWHLGFVWKGRFYYYLPAHDPEFANYSPGKVHLLFCVADALKRGLKCFDHLRGEENYKSGWAREVAALYATSYENPRWSSKVRVALGAARSKAAKLMGGGLP